MEQLTEALFYGTWRSYKVFLNAGEAKNHSKNTYQEFSFDEDKQLTISTYSNGKRKMLWETREWTVVLKDKRHYLKINGKQLPYEVITINHVALVLQDTQTLEKFFCALPETWKAYVSSPVPSAL